MASPNQPPPFDMHSFFNPPNPNPNLSSPFPSSTPPPPSASSSYPPPAGPFSPFPTNNNNNYPYENNHQHFPIHHNNLQQHRSLSFPTPPLQPQPIPPPSNPNAGARLMALPSAPQPSPPQQPPPVFVPFSSDLGNSPHIPQPSAALTAPSAATAALTRLPSSKVPKGRHLIGDRVEYDVDVRLPGEVQPQLEAAHISLKMLDRNPFLGRQIAVNKSYMCYAFCLGNIMVRNIHTAVLLGGHNQRVTDLAFFAEDVHLLASVASDGRVYVWKIAEGLDDKNKPQITANIVIAIQIVAEEKVEHPHICWHRHKQENLVVGMGKYVLRIDTTKVANGETFVAEDPPKCPVDKLIDGVQLVGTHDGEVTDLSMCQRMTNRLVSASLDGTIKIWEERKTQPLAILRPHGGHPVFSASFFTAPHRPDHIVLITAGPQNREVKLWVSAGEEGWLLPSNAESWKCTQTLELKSSAQPSLKDAFFNQVASLPDAGLLLLANAKRNAIYAVHLEYGPNPESTHMDYIAEFTVTMPILSFTGTSDILPHGEHTVQIYCVQTRAIQQYALDVAQCLPPPLENLGLDKSDSSVSRDAIAAEGFTSLDSSAGRTSEMPVPSFALKTLMQPSSTDSGLVARYPLSSGQSNEFGQQTMAMQESPNQLLTAQKEMQKEGRRLEASLGRTMEKLLRDGIQNVTGFVTNFMNKDLPSILEKTVKKEMASVGQAVARSMSPAVEKIISSSIVESFQRGGDKAVNQLDKSVNSKLEATVARQIQAQFQTTAKQALQEALKSSFETTVVPAFEMSCKSMFEQVDVTFQKGMAEHSTAVQQRLEAGPTSLAVTLRDSINSASAVTQTLSREEFEGQRKLVELATTTTNSGTLSPLPMQLNNGPLLHEKVEAPLDSTKELARLISERKYEEAFIAALHRSDVSIVSWLCSQVDLHGLLTMVPLPLSQGVLLSLLQQLACDINNDTPRKVAWMAHAAATINPSALN